MGDKHNCLGLEESATFSGGNYFTFMNWIGENDTVDLDMQLIKKNSVKRKAGYYGLYFGWTQWGQIKRFFKGS